MNTKIFFTKLFVTLSLLILVMVGLVGCGTLEVGALPADSSSMRLGDANESEASQDKGIEFGIEPTPTPETLTYTNDLYGFKFDYPETWTLSEIDHGIVLMQDNNRLTVHFRWTNEDSAPFRTGMAAGTPIYSDKLSFMGQVVPVYSVELDHLVKYVLYGEDGVVTMDDLVLVLILEDLETDYLTLDLPETIMAEAVRILESFERSAANGSNPAFAPTQKQDPAALDNAAIDMSVYENQEAGFTFSYPSFMSIMEEPNKVILKDAENVQLIIAYRRVDESINISGFPQPPGQFVSYGEVGFLSQTVEVVVDKHDGLTKAAYLGIPGMELGERTPLRFVIRLESTGGGSISNAQVDEILPIFQSFGLVGWTD